PGGLSEDRARQRHHALDRGGPPRAAGAARPLCRVQPALRPGHDLRPEDRRQRRLDPLLDAADRALAVSAGLPAAYAPQQDAALKAIAAWRRDGGSQVFRLFGYAGTGKTTL